MTIYQRFTELYQQLNQESITQLGCVYADKISFVDPVNQLNGLSQLQRYFADLLENTLECRFKIIRWQIEEQQAFVTWVMEFRHPNIAKGQTIRVNGCSELTTENDKIIHQRDYYDMGEMLYEHLPLLGRIIRWLKSRLQL